MEHAFHNNRSHMMDYIYYSLTIILPEGKGNDNLNEQHDNDLIDLRRRKQTLHSLNDFHGL